MLIAIGSDHRGVEYKKFVRDCLNELGIEFKDFGPFDISPVDYPDIAGAVCGAVIAGQCKYGILICGTGIGMSIAANKIKGIRAALCVDAFMAGRARLHNDANVLCLGAERGKDGVNTLLKTFISTDYEGGRHQNRLDKIMRMETPC